MSELMIHRSWNLVFGQLEMQQIFVIPAWLLTEQILLSKNVTFFVCSFFNSQLCSWFLYRSRCVWCRFFVQIMMDDHIDRPRNLFGVLKTSSKRIQNLILVQVVYRSYCYLTWKVV
jgi:hypothetical protein